MKHTWFPLSQEAKPWLVQEVCDPVDRCWTVSSFFYPGALVIFCLNNCHFWILLVFWVNVLVHVWIAVRRFQSWLPSPIRCLIEHVSTEIVPSHVEFQTPDRQAQDVCFKGEGLCVIYLKESTRGNPSQLSFPGEPDIQSGWWSNASWDWHAHRFTLLLLNFQVANQDKHR